MKKMIVLGLLLAIVGCGGSDSTSGSSSDVVTPAVSSPQALQKKELKLTANLNQCEDGVAAHDAELFIYDNEWNLESTHKPNEHGEFLLELDKQFVNIALIKKTEHREVTIHTYQSAPVADLGTVLFKGFTAQTENRCISENLFITVNTVGPTNLSTLYGYVGDDGFLEINKRFDVFSPAEFPLRISNSLYVKRKVGETWPTVLVSGFFRDDTREFIGTLENYDASEQNQYSVSLDKNLTSLNAIIQGEYDSLSAFAIGTSGKESSFKRFTSEPNTLKVLLGVDSFPKFGAEAYTSAKIETPDFSGTFTIQTRAKLTDLDETSDIVLNVPPIDVWKNSVENFDVNAKNYDFSQFHEYSLVRIKKDQTFSDTFTGPTVRVIQHHLGPLNGPIPIIDLPEGYVEDVSLDNAQLTIVELTVEKHAELTNYQDYLIKLGERSLLNDLTRQSGFWSQYNELRLFKLTHLR